MKVARLKVVVPLAILFFLLVVLSVYMTTGRDNGISDYRPSNYNNERYVQYSFTLQNGTNRVIEKADFWTYAPVSLTSTQKRNWLDASYPFLTEKDEFGNDILHFTFNNFPPFGSKIITIKSKVAFSDVANRIPVENPDSYLKPERFVESEASEIKSVAGQLAARTSALTAANTFNWVAANLRYSGYQRNELGALYALRNKHGDCTEFMYLFMALCRANRIPSRGLAGYIIGKDGILNPGDYHNWAEFEYDGAWRIADAQQKTFMKTSPQYLTMQVLGEPGKDREIKFHKFRFSGDGLKVKMN